MKLRLRALPPMIEMPQERPFPPVRSVRIRDLEVTVQTGVRNPSRGVLVTDLLSGVDGPYPTEGWMKRHAY